jgi:hypothetical protein
MNDTRVPSHVSAGPTVSWVAIAPARAAASELRLNPIDSSRRIVAGLAAIAFVATTRNVTPEPVHAVATLLGTGLAALSLLWLALVGASIRRRIRPIDVDFAGSPGRYRLHRTADGAVHVLLDGHAAVRLVRGASSDHLVIYDQPEGEHDRAELGAALGQAMILAGEIERHPRRPRAYATLRRPVSPRRFDVSLS